MRIKGTLLLMATLAGVSACGGDDDDRPTAAFSAECIEFLCKFDASASTSATGGSLQYRWTFGDGQSASGGTVVHPYIQGGEYDVRLVVFDQSGNSAAITNTVSPTDNPVATFYTDIRRSFASLLVILDSAIPLASGGDWIQDAAEVEGVPEGDGYALLCEDEGSVIVQSWNDDNTNLTVDIDETVRAIPLDCETSTTGLISSRSSADFKNDFDSDVFRIETPSDSGFGIRTEAYASWYARGPIDFTVTRDSSAVIDHLQFDSTEMELLYRPDDGLQSLTIPAEVSLAWNAPNLTGITGNMTYRYGTGASDLPVQINIVSAVDIGVTGDDLRMTNGHITLTLETAEIDISVDGDPEYLLVEVDTNGDGTPDLTGRYPQTLTIVRFTN